MRRLVIVVSLVLAVFGVFILQACGGAGSPRAGTPGVAPGSFVLQAPEAYYAASNEPGVRLRLSVSAGVEVYEVHRNGARFAVLEALTPEFDDAAGVAAGNTYSYAVHARNGSGTASTPVRSVAVPASICREPPGGPGGQGKRTVISAGLTHSLALRGDGTVWAWGTGVLGSGTLRDERTPVQVTGLANIVSISAGELHSLALRGDGTVWAWGVNLTGQLGTGTNSHELTPARITDLTNITSIAAGRYHSLALRGDGTVWVWGSNRFGQLGDGTNADRYTPVQVTGLANITSINADFQHALALSGDGTVWAWELT